MLTLTSNQLNMETTLLFLAACLMFSGVHGVSQSMSCSTVNGKTICNKQASEGNTAMSSSAAGFGGDSSFQQTYAGAGGPSQWDSSSQSVKSGYPGGSYNPPIPYNYGTQDYPGSFDGGPYSDVPGYVASGSPNIFGGSQAGGFAIAGGGPYSGVSSYVGSGSPNFFGGPQAGGFAIAGGGPYSGVSSYVGSVSPNIQAGPQAGGFAIAGGGPFTGVSGYVGSGSPNFFGGSQAGGVAIAGGGPFTGVSSYAASGSPNIFGGSQGGGAFAGGFAGAGNIPFNSPAVGYPAQDSSSPNDGAFSRSGPMPGAAGNPFEFVNQFMGGFIGRR